MECRNFCRKPWHQRTDAPNPLGATTKGGLNLSVRLSDEVLAAKTALVCL